MQKHDGPRDPGNDNRPKRTITWWLMLVIFGIRDPAAKKRGPADRMASPSLLERVTKDAPAVKACQGRPKLKCAGSLKLYRTAGCLDAWVIGAEGATDLLTFQLEWSSVTLTDKTGGD